MTKPRNKQFVFLAVCGAFLIITALSSCSSSPSVGFGEKRRCSLDADCAQNEICYQGFCADPSLFAPETSEITEKDGDMPGDVELPFDDIADNDQKTELADESFEDIDVKCGKDPDCPSGYICECANPQSCKCAPDCTKTGCASYEGKCNKNTGRCEWCDPLCEKDEFCNFAPNGSWFCGNPCEPPCPEGTVCSYNLCLQKKCPICPPCYACSALTGFTCKQIEGCTDGDVDTDVDVSVGKSVNNQPGAFFPPNPNPIFMPKCSQAATPCIEGNNNCCSGACVMGYCL